MTDVRAQVIARDGEGCYLCPSTDVRAFRIRPDGGDGVDNLVAMCGTCRQFFADGGRHRGSYMTEHRFVDLNRRMGKRYRKPVPNIRNVMRTLGAKVT